MVYEALAGLLVLVHFGFILFAMTGGLLFLRYRWMPFLHLPAAVWAVAVMAFGWICPLTPLENAMRRGREMGHRALELDVLSDNPAVRFYESLGLELYAETRAPAPQAFGVPPEYRMGRAL